MKRLAAVELACVLGVWAAAIALIRPLGEFPLLDDWDFAIATWNFARTGHFHFTQFTAVSLRAMVLWGAAWTRIFGESFFVLRCSTLALAAIAIVVVHTTLRLAGLARTPRIIATLAFAFHPVFLWASCTYMTEVPFVCVSAVALLLIWRGLAREHAGLIALGCVAAIVSCFIRQTGVINLIAPAVVVAFSRRKFLPIFAGALAIIAAIVVVRPDWLSGSPAEFASQYKMWHESSFRLPEQIGLAYHYFVFNAQNCALFFLPLVIAAAFAARRKFVVAAAILILFRVQHLVNIGIAMPYFAFAPGEDLLQGNIFIDFGLGPPTLQDVWLLKHPYPFHLLAAGKLLVTYISVIAGALLLATIVRARDLLSQLAIALTALSTAALVASGVYWDRYSLDSAWSAGIALAVLVPWEKRAARLASITALIIVIIFTTLSVQEYFAWQRARWTAFTVLRAGGVAGTDIDGGSEALNFFEISKMTRIEARRRMAIRPPRRFVIAFAPLPGYTVVARYPFEGWFGAHRGAICVLRRT